MDIAKFLNPEATAIFLQFVQVLHHAEARGKEFATFSMPDKRPLHIESLDCYDLPQWGKARLYTLYHVDLVNGDHMYMPEVSFLVIEKNPFIPNGQPAVCPGSLNEGDKYLYQNSLQIEDDGTLQFVEDCIYEHKQFAETWMQKLQNEGFLKVAARKLQRMAKPKK